MEFRADVNMRINKKALDYALCHLIFVADK